MNSFYLNSEPGVRHTACQESAYYIGTHEEILHSSSRPASDFQSSEFIRVIQSCRELDTYMFTQI
jgi:hypothetical protein